jgi:DNA-binding response OmpR family regulator
MILIVDDEVQILKTLQMALDHQGVVARTASSAEEGWKELQKKRPELLLCDVNMPKSDGFSLVEKVRNEPALADLRVMFMTGLPTQEHVLQIRKLKAYGMIQKPFVLQDFIQAVGKALAEPG